MCKFELCQNVLTRCVEHDLAKLAHDLSAYDRQTTPLLRDVRVNIEYRAHTGTNKIDSYVGQPHILRSRSIRDFHCRAEKQTPLNVAYAVCDMGRYPDLQISFP